MYIAVLVYLQHWLLSTSTKWRFFLGHNWSYEPFFFSTHLSISAIVYLIVLIFFPSGWSFATHTSHTHTHTHPPTHPHTHTLAHTHVSSLSHTHTHTRTYTHAHPHTCAASVVCRCVCMCVCVQACTHLQFTLSQWCRFPIYFQPSDFVLYFLPGTSIEITIIAIGDNCAESNCMRAYTKTQKIPTYTQKIRIHSQDPYTLSKRAPCTLTHYSITDDAVHIQCSVIQCSVIISNVVWVYVGNAVWVYSCMWWECRECGVSVYSAVYINNAVWGYNCRECGVSVYSTVYICYCRVKV